MTENIEMLAGLLTIACDGRPSSLEFDKDSGKYTASIFSDDKSKMVTFEATSDDLNSPQFKERVIAPALRNLDGAMFSERERALLSAFRSIACASAGS